MKLTREARDTLFLLVTIAAILAPHAPHLPLWAGAICLLMLAWRGWLAWQQQPLPGRWPLVALLLAISTLILLNYRSFFRAEAGITFLAMLMALKTLELRARRDAFVVFFLGFFLVLTQFRYSQSLPTALWMLGAVWALLTALVLAQMPVGQPSLALAARQAARVTAFGLPAMILLYLLFPRIAPLWGLPADNIGRTGLSNQMTFGAMSEIANDDSIALRVRFEGPEPPPSERYFRGPVLDRFDGRVWRTQASPQRPDQITTAGTPWRYEMTLEPLRIGVLPLLEMAAAEPGDGRSIGPYLLKLGPQAQWLSPRPITERLRFAALAYPGRELGANQTPVSLADDLALPAGLNPRTRAWAQALRARGEFARLDEGQRPPALAQAVLKHIAGSDFLYTLVPGRYGETTPHVIDEFWFDRRLGFCEHFASAFVFIMRAMGVPARVVTGFQGMDAEPQDGWRIVRNSNAHAWAEYWVPGHGWLRADPTAAIAPDRILRGLALRPAPGALERLSPAIGAVSSTLRHVLETIDNRWQQMVLNYSRQDQFDLLKSMGFEQPDWLALGRVSAAVIAVLTLAAGAWNRWQARPHDGWTRQRERLLRHLQRLGVGAAAHESPARWAIEVEQHFGAEGASLARLLRTLEHSRYAPHARPLDWRSRWRWWRELHAATRMLRTKS
jgi:transglutaminase-like putative cysteine protease